MRLQMLLKNLIHALLGFLFPKRKGVHRFKESKLAHRLLDGLSGLEVGPATHNPFGLNTRNVGLKDAIYEAEQISLTGEMAPIHIEAVADAIPVASESEDFLLSSHVIEHCPDLIKALVEWYRIIKPAGILYLIAPHREASPGDRGRQLTTWDHVFSDYRRKISTDQEPEAGTFGHCHYHVLEIERMKAFVQKVFGERLVLIAEQAVDDKIGNGFTLVYRKAVSLSEAFPWSIRLNDEVISVHANQA